MPGVAAVARVHQHRVQPVHDGVPVVLRHVGPDVQELGVPHILRGEGVSAIFLARAKAVPAALRAHLSREGTQHCWGKAAGLQLSSSCARDPSQDPSWDPSRDPSLCSSQQGLGLGARRALTFVILPPLKLAKRFSESVRTLEARWMVKRLLAGTFFLHL